MEISESIFDLAERSNEKERRIRYKERKEKMRKNIGLSKKAIVINVSAIFFFF